MSVVVADPVGIEVEYPQGPKVPEGDLQTHRRVELFVALCHWLEPRSDAWVCSDINIYYRQGDPRVVVAPDIAVAFGVDREALEGSGTYRVWEVGAPPVFALEIASPTTYKRDLRAKPATFAALGVTEYWRLDPTGGDYFTPPLQGEHRRGGHWETIPTRRGDGDDTLTGHSAALGLDLHWQPPKLRLHDPATGTWLLDQDDRKTAHLAEATARRAAESRARAAEAELAALRRQAGHHPPT